MFSREPLSEYLERYKENLRREIKSEVNITRFNLNEYEETLVKKYTVETPVLDEDEIKYDASEEYDDSFYRTKYYEVIIPFNGNQHIFEMTPSTYTLNRPHGEIEESQLIIKIRVDNTRAEEIKREIRTNLEKIKKYLEWAKSDVGKHNKWIRINTQGLIQEGYKVRTKEHELFSSLGFPKIEKKKELVPMPEIGNSMDSLEYDAFICHASEDKEDFVSNLATKLIDEGLNIWYDDFTLNLGDSLRRSIDKGLTNSKYGIVILSKHFFAKEWPQKELDGLFQKEVEGRKVILPIWHGVEYRDVVKYSPTLADKIAVKSQDGLEKIIESILRAIM